MTPIHFKRAMELLFGAAWVGAAAEHFNIRPNKIQRMAAGTERIYPDTAERIVGCLKTKMQETATLLEIMDRAEAIAAYEAEVAACADCQRDGCCNKHLPF
jgi:plasmid maintenance system antidote protein VapI